MIYDNVILCGKTVRYEKMGYIMAKIEPRGKKIAMN